MGEVSAKRLSRDAVQACISRLPELLWSNGEAFLDTQLPDGKAEVANVIGYLPDAAKGEVPPPDQPNVNLAAGYGVMYSRCRPGHGAAAHAHDVHESLIVLDGTWRVEWEDLEGQTSVVLGPWDTITAPPGVEVSFHNETPAEGREDGVMLSIIGSDDPGIRFSDRVVERMRSLGILTD